MTNPPQEFPAAADKVAELSEKMNQMQRTQESPPQSAREFFANVSCLPALPATATAIIMSLMDEFSTLENVANVLEKDPAVTARILGLTNSAFFGQKREVTSVRDAVIRVLGLDLTRGIALGIALGQTLDTDQCPHFDTPLYWSVAVRCAMINAWLVDSVTSLTDSEKRTAYAAGLMADLGMIALVAIEPGSMNKLLAANGQTEPALREAILGEFSFDQHEAGGTIAEIWNLPECFIDVIASSSAWHDASSASNLAAVTRLSYRMALHNVHLNDNIENLTALGEQLGLQDKTQSLLAGEVNILASADDVAATLSGR